MFGWPEVESQRSDRLPSEPVYKTLCWKCCASKVYRENRVFLGVFAWLFDFKRWSTCIVTSGTHGIGNSHFVDLPTANAGMGLRCQTVVFEFSKINVTWKILSMNSFMNHFVCHPILKKYSTQSDTLNIRKSGPRSFTNWEFRKDNYRRSKPRGFPQYVVFGH